MNSNAVRVYTSRSYFKSSETIIDNEAYFLNSVSKINLSEDSLEAMKNIDEAVLLDENTGLIQTKFGLGKISDLSTGCKTVLNCIYLNESKNQQVKAIYAVECGWNALEELFKYISKTGFDIAIIVEQRDKIFMCSDRTYIVNDEKTVDSAFSIY